MLLLTMITISVIGFKYAYMMGQQPYWSFFNDFYNNYNFTFSWLNWGRESGGSLHNTECDKAIQKVHGQAAFLADWFHKSWKDSYIWTEQQFHLCVTGTQQS